MEGGVIVQQIHSKLLQTAFRISGRRQARTAWQAAACLSKVKAVSQAKHAQRGLILQARFAWTEDCSLIVQVHDSEHIHVLTLCSQK